MKSAFCCIALILCLGCTQMKLVLPNDTEIEVMSTVFSHKEVVVKDGSGMEISLIGENASLELVKDVLDAID